jgi:glycogen debranching enzyme
MKNKIVVFVFIYMTFSFDLFSQFPMKKILSQQVYDIEMENKFASENVFLKKTADNSMPPKFDDVRQLLPQPYWMNHSAAIDCYWRAWQIAFSNLKAIKEGSGYISPFIDPGFNNCIFMWDSNFMMFFGKYGEHAFHFQGTMDNFYRKQERDGYICREINNTTGQPKFERYNVSSTGPNIMPWCEWEYYLTFKDKKRLAEVFPPLLAYYQWTSKYRTWQDGTYFSSGWGCGMDNQPRINPEYNERWDTGFMSWIDATLHAVMSGKTLIKMAHELGRDSDILSVKTEVDALTVTVNRNMWDEKSAFYYDKQRDGSLTKVLSVAGYWALLAEIVPPERVERFIAHLSDSAEFNRPHRVPTLAASDPSYDRAGGYWKGAIWAPTNYMILRGLTRYHQDSLAYAIAKNHSDAIVDVFKKTNTFYENYSPEFNQGNDKDNFVGWTGISAINVLLEYVLGIRPDVLNNKLTIVVNEIDEYGVRSYPFGKDGILEIKVAKRKTKYSEPKVTIKSTVDLTIEVKWQGEHKEFLVTANSLKK